MAGFDPEVFGAPASSGFDPEVFNAPGIKPTQLPTVQPKPEAGTGSGVLDRANAFATGYWRGLTNLVGLPVDTVQNVIDLGKAAIGAPYIALTGKVPPAALQVGDRADVVGSGANLSRAATGTNIGSAMLNAANPEYQGGYLQTAGAGMTGVMAPNTGLQAANQALIGSGSAMAAKLGYDVTGDPATAVIAGLSPMGAQQAITAGTKYAVRGGEAGRQQMEQRIQDLKNAGVANPTLGLASGNKMIGGIENILQSTPGAVNIMGRARDSAISGLRGTVEDAANLASTNRGALESGTAIQSGIKNFKNDFKGTQEQLYNRLGQYMPPQYPTDIVQTRGALAGLNADIPGAPALSKFFKNSKIQALESALQSDTAGNPPGVMVTPRPAVAGGGLMNAPVSPPPVQTPIPGSQLDTLPFEAVKKTRTLVGNEIADNSLMSQVPLSKWKPLYAAISQDLGNSAQRAGPEASQAFNRATDYTRAGSQRLERVAPFAQTTAPEQAFTAMVNASKENVSTLQAVKKTLPTDARGTIAGTIIERLGKATNGVQNDTGTAWSPETFLTNWNKMAPKARDELFSGFPNSDAVKSNVDSVAKAASMMRDSSKMWANPSGTAANMWARGTLGALGIGGGAAGLGLLNPMVPAGAAMSLLGTNRLASGLTSPKVVQAMANRGYVSPELLNAQAMGLLAPDLLRQAGQ
jgi:hypothetical protein